MSTAELAARAEAEDYAAWFRALADGTRVKIVSLLARHGRPMKVAEIVAAVQVGQSTVSRHRKVLPHQRRLREQLPDRRRAGGRARGTTARVPGAGVPTVAAALPRAGRPR